MSGDDADVDEKAGAPDAPPAAGGSQVPADGVDLSKAGSGTDAGGSSSRELPKIEQDEEADTSATTDGGETDGDVGGRSRSWTPTLVILRTVVVLVVMGILYYEFAPVTKTEHGRVSQLVPAASGLKAFPGKPKGAAIPISSAQINSLTAAQKAAPNKTGAYQEQWGSGNGQPAIEAVVFLTADQATAGKVTAEIAKVSLAADAESSQGFTQQSRFSVPGIAGSQGVQYGAKAQPGSSVDTLAVALAHVGRYTILAEGIGTSADTRSNVESLLRTQHQLVTAKGDGFSFNVTHEPQTATILWAVGTGVAVIVIGFGPVIVGGIRRRQREARQAQLDAMVRGHETVTKRRRTQG